MSIDTSLWSSANYQIILKWTKSSIFLLFYAFLRKEGLVIIVMRFGKPLSKTLRLGAIWNINQECVYIDACRPLTKPSKRVLLTQSSCANYALRYHISNTSASTYIGHLYDLGEKRQINVEIWLECRNIGLGQTWNQNVVNIYCSILHLRWGLVDFRLDPRASMNPTWVNIKPRP